MRTVARRLLVLGCILLAAGAAEAKEPLRRSAAQRRYDSGVAHYKAKEYAEAVTDMEAAVAMRAEPPWVFNLAQASRLAGQLDKALFFYRRYLELEPDADNRADVEQRIAEVEKARGPTHTATVAPPPAPPPSVPPAATAPVPAPPPPPPSVDLPRTPYQLGARVRGIFVTTAMLMPYLQAATSMESWSVGLEFIYRRPKFDVVTSFDISSIDVHDGNWLANNHMAEVDTHYLQFRGVYFISVDVSILGHNDLTRWLEIRYGGGLGVGGVTGDVFTTDNVGPQCSIKNVNNVSLCNPFNVTPPPTGAAFDNGLKAAGRKSSSDKPPAMGVVNILVGLRFKLPKKVSAQVELGFRDAIFFGVGTHYSF